MNKTKEKDKIFFNKLADELERCFPKGELCDCGKRLPCRSKALVLNAFANIFHVELLDQPKTKEQEWEKVFRGFYNDNESGGSSRWLVAPSTVEIFIKSVEKEAIQKERKRIVKVIEKKGTHDFAEEGGLEYTVHEDFLKELSK